MRQISCNMALAAEPENTRWKVAVARALPHEQKPQSLAMFREAAAQGDAEAYYELYEHHRVWERADLDKVPNVSRAEAERSLRKAAELAHPYSIRTLASLLDRGTTVKRDPAAARYWAERGAANPAKDESLGDLMVFLGRMLAASDNPEERSRGLDILEKRAPTPQYGAKTALANAIRKQDPVRARKLLEEARDRDPGGATPPLAEMLIAGEGGPADPKRALSLLKSRSNSAAANGVLGQLYLEGKLVPRDVQEAVRLIGQAATWDLEARLQEARLLAQHPEVRDSNPKLTLYYVTEAAELGEPGAMAALIDLKLSKNPQFQDRPGACKLIETAANSGDQVLAQRLAECRAN
jgi:TPR repeat protein